MRFRILAGALAFLGACWGAAGLAHAQPESRTEKSNTADPLIQACFIGAPNAASVESAARAAGGVSHADTRFADAHASIENPSHLGQWRAPGAARTRWTLGYSEGDLAGLPARACYGAQTAEPVPAFLAGIAQRWRLIAVMAPTSIADGEGVRETYAARISGADALVIVEWTGARDTAYPDVTVVTFPGGLGAAETQANNL